MYIYTHTHIYIYIYAYIEDRMDADVALDPPGDDPAHGFVRPRHLMFRPRF